MKTETIEVITISILPTANPMLKLSRSTPRCSPITSTQAGLDAARREMLQKN
jgi:hypothetical protein